MSLRLQLRLPSKRACARLNAKPGASRFKLGVKYFDTGCAQAQALHVTITFPVQSWSPHRALEKRFS